MWKAMQNPYQNPVKKDGKNALFVVCIGNELVADDAAGHEVYTRLETMDLPPEARVEYTGLGGIDLLDRLQGDERVMIVVDAVQLGAAAGTIHVMPWEEIPSFGSESAISMHGIGLREAIHIGKILYPERIPPEIVLVGIEGRCFNQMRDSMTPATAAATVEAAELIRSKLFTYREEPLI